MHKGRKAQYSKLSSSKVCGPAKESLRHEVNKINSKKSPLSDFEAPLGERFPIVGIGASAGGLEAFTQLFSNMPVQTGIGFVIIQHLDPSHDSLTAEILARTTQMPVVEIREGMHVEPNHVYVIPPNTDTAIINGILSLLPRAVTRG